MKNQMFGNRHILVKTGIFLLSIGALAVWPATAAAQTAPLSCNGQQITVSTDTVARYTLFTGRFVEGKTYLHWDVREQQCDGLYTVFRSLDGLTYEELGQRKGVGVPISISIAWYFQDEDPPVGTAWYQVIHFASDKTCLVSEKIPVTRGDDFLTGAK